MFNFFYFLICRNFRSQRNIQNCGKCKKMFEKKVSKTILRWFVSKFRLKNCGNITKRSWSSGVSLKHFQFFWKFLKI